MPEILEKVMLDKSIVPPNEIIVEFSADELPLPGFRAAYKYWQDHCNGTIIPHVSNLDPLSLPARALPIMAVFGVEGDVPEFTVRLVGTDIVEKTGANITGMNVRDIPESDEQIERFTWVARTGRPYVTHTSAKWAPKPHKSYDVIVLPFGKDGRVTRLLALLDVHMELPNR